jgi:excinuclease UvrABC nuclease subunit
MERSALTAQSIPDKSGVYYFLGAKKEILYIGKATRLRSRVKSYFDSSLREKRSALIEAMVRDAKSISWTVTDSVLEAMLLEVNLIRTHKPRCNTRSKDDKSYNHLVITREEFPRVLVVRGKDLQEEGEHAYTDIFGPFPNGTLFKEALRIIRKLFQFYDTKKEVMSAKSKLERGKIDFNRQIGLYPENVTKRTYARTIEHIRLLFKGEKQKIIKDLTSLMNRAAKQEDFEEAARLRNKIRALEHIQDVSLIKNEHRVHHDDRTMRIEAYDVAHFGGDNMVGAMVVVKGGEPDKSEYRKFKIDKYTSSNDVGALKDILTRRLLHTEWQLPGLIVVDGSTAQKNVAEQCLRKNNLTIPVVGVVKDEHHKPKRIIGAKKLVEEHKHSILLANAEAHRFAITYHKSKRKIV